MTLPTVLVRTGPAVQVLPGTYLALFTIVRSRGGLGIPHMRGSRVFRDQRAVGRRGYAYPLIQSG